MCLRASHAKAYFSGQFIENFSISASRRPSFSIPFAIQASAALDNFGHIDEARRTGARLPLTALVDQFYADVQANGGNRWDTSSLISRLEK